MKKIVLSAILLTSIISCTNNDKVVDSKKETKQEMKAENSENPIDLEKSLVYWKGTKAIGGGHQGTVKFANGDLKFDQDVFKGGSFSIDMSTIACSDVKDKESNADLVGHLMSKDFFAVTEFPTAEINIFDAALIEGNRYKCAAKVRIKDVEKQLVFEVDLHNKDSKHAIVGKLNFDRTQFGVVYNSSNFFKALGDKVINDDIIIKFELVQK